MTGSTLVRITALLLLLVFPVQLLAVAYLPCRHAAAPDNGRAAHCHAAVDQTAQDRADDRDAGASSGAPGFQDCNKCQVASVFASMHGADRVNNRFSNPAPLVVSERLSYFYHLYPDSPRRPPRTGF